MQVKELYKLLEQNGAQEEASRIIHSIQSDELIYAYFENSSSEESAKIASLCTENRFNPGTLGLLSLNQKLVDDSYPEGKLHNGLLENYIVFFESFLQLDLPPTSLDNAAKLAVVLLEKKRITPDWRTIWLEIVKRMQITDGLVLKKLWGTVLVLVLNLIEDKNELLASLSGLESLLQTRSLLVHGLLGIPADKNTLAAWLVESTSDQPFSVFENTLFDLIGVNERNLAITAAQIFAEKYLSDPAEVMRSDLSSEELEKILEEVLKLKQSSSIAQIAHNYSLAARYFDLSQALLETINKGFDIQKKSLQRKNPSPLISATEKSTIQMAQSGMETEFSAEKLPLVIDSFQDDVQLLLSIDEVKRIYQSGQKEVARAELQKIFSDPNDEKIIHLARTHSRFDPEWNPVNRIYDFLDMEETALAEKLALETIKTNPASESASQAAAMAFIASGKHEKALPILEVLSFSESKDVNLLRILADCYDKTGDASSSLKVRRVIVDHFDSSADLLDFAESAIQCGMAEEAQKAAQKVLDNDPLDSLALTKIARSLALQGQKIEAEEYFQKALDAGVARPHVWVTYADFLFGQKEYQKAIESLRKGLIVLPDDISIRRKLAEILMESGSAAEALPYLNELAAETNDVQLEILRVEAMKILGLTEYKDLIEELHQKFPENLEVTQEHAAELIKEGRHEEAKKIIQEKFEKIDPEDETALTYVDALIGLDVKNTGEAKTVSTAESIKAKNILNASLEKNPDHTRANLLLGEFYLQKDRFNDAYEVYSSLMAKQTGIDKTLLERIQAGFAIAAANLGKFEQALAAIKQAVDTKPDWVGLRKIFAQIYALAGEIAEAVHEAQIVIHTGSQLIEGIFWFTSFLTSLGKENEAIGVIEKAMAENPEDIFLRCKMAELLFRNNKTEEARSALALVKEKLLALEKPTELFACAKIFSVIADEEATLICLQKIADGNDSIESKIDLAGYLCLIGRYQDSLKQLRNIDDAPWIKLFEMDVLMRFAASELSEFDHEENYVMPENFSLNMEFAPASWQKLLTSSNPLLALQARISFTLENPEKSFELAKKWYALDGEDIEAKLLMLESSLAVGEKPDDEIFSGLMQRSSENEHMQAHLIALWVDDLVDKGQAVEAQQLIEKFGDLPSLSLKIASIRIVNLSGHIVDAETIFDEVLGEVRSLEHDGDLSFFGLARMAVNAGVTLKRWNDVLAFSQQLANTFSWNIQVIDQALSVLVQAKEFEELSRSLAITRHSPNQYFTQHDAAELFECLSAMAIGKAENTVKRWLLRGKMVIQPDDDNIRSFALITNAAEDSAAMAAALYANGQKETALQVAKKFSDHPAMLIGMAKIHAQEDEIHLSLECLNSLIAADPLNPVAFAFRSLLYEESENLDHAINDLEQAVSDWPDEIKWRTKTAALWSKYGNHKNALIQLESAYEIDPHDVDVVLELAKVCLEDRQPDRCIEYVEIFTQENPNLYEAWEVLSEAYAMQGDMANALAAAQRAGKINTFSLKPYLMTGKIYLDSGDLDKAYTQAKAAINQNKKDAEVVLFLARVLHAKGEERQALATLETMHRCDNVTAQTMIDHVNLVREINGSASAKELIASLSGKFPENVELMKLLASAQVENGDTIEAEATAKKALLVDPDEPDIHMFLGKLNADSGQLDKAISHLSQGITHRAANLDGYLLLSKVYEQQREYSKAIDTLKKAMEVSPSDTRSFVAAANLYRNSKNYSAAEQVLQKAVEIDPQDISLRRQLGALLALKLVHHSQEASMNS